MKPLRIAQFFICFFSLISIPQSYAQEQTLRRETDIELQSCDRSQFTEGLPESNAYLNALMRHIARENPEVFHGDLAPDRLCIGVKYLDGGARAWATAERRMITINHGLILRARNDAQMALVVSHEMAHLSLRHIHTDPDTESSQDEADADRVGAHFFLKAGFTADELAWRQQQIADVLAQLGITPGQHPGERAMPINADGTPLMHAPAPDISSSERIANGYRACGVTNPATMSEPSIGNLRYPSECWTIWDLRHGAPARSATYRAWMTDERSITNLALTPGLQDAKDELEGFVFVNPTDETKYDSAPENPGAPPPKVDAPEDDN